MAAKDALFIYVTCPDAGHAATLGRALVERNLAACVNVFSGMQSIYRWQGAIETGAEAVMIVKSVEAHFEAVCSFIRANHPYECPCIVALPIVAGDKNYLDWITQSCRS